MAMFNQQGQSVGVQINIGTEPTVEPQQKPVAIICDLDGTLAIHDGRGPYEYDQCDTDLVNEAVREVLLCIKENPYTQIERIIYVSGREDSCREKTLTWLKQHMCYFDGLLFMRRTKDHRKDFIVKEEIYREHIEPHYDVLFCLDDRDQVVKLWRSLGLTCFQVAEGSF